MKFFSVLLISLLLAAILFAPRGSDDTGSSGDDDGTLDQGRGDASGTDGSMADTTASGLRNRQEREKFKADRLREMEANRNRFANVNCNSATTARERILCSMSTSNTGATATPEECRTLASEAMMAKCLERHGKLRVCNSLAEDKREICLKKAVGLDERKDIRQEIASCANTTAATCMTGLKQKTYELIKARITALEEKAKRFAEKGIVSQEKAADFIAWLEDAKKRFDSAQTTKDKRAVIQEIKTSWGRFVSEARANYNALKGDETPPKPPPEGNNTNSTNSTGAAS